MQLHLSIEGNLTADPSIDHLEDGTPVTHFRVLHTRRVRIDGQWRDGTVTGVDVTCWGQLAEPAAESYKGDTVIVTGTDPLAQAWVARDSGTASRCLGPRQRLGPACSHRGIG